MRLTGGCCGILCVKLFIPSATHSFMRSSTSAALPQEHKLFRIGPYCWLGVLAFIDGSKERNFWLKVNNVIWITWSANVPDDKGDFIYLPTTTYWSSCLSAYIMYQIFKILVENLVMGSNLQLPGTGSCTKWVDLHVAPPPPPPH